MGSVSSHWFVGGSVSSHWFVGLCVLPLVCMGSVSSHWFVGALCPPICLWGLCVLRLVCRGSVSSHWYVGALCPSIGLKGLCVLPLVCGSSVFGLRFVMHNLVSFLVSNHLDEDARAGCFAIIVFLTSFVCMCPAVLSHGAVGWSALCDFGFS